MKVIFTKGLPGAGKSFWAKEFVTKNQSQWILVNRDSLRHMRGTYWVPKQEELITQWERATALIALQNGFNVVVDATNLNPDYVKNFKEYLNQNVVGELQFETKDFTDISVEECIKRDLKRANSVGEKVIRGMYEKYIEIPALPLVQNKGLTKAIIVDLDGTLCEMNGRGPFEWNKVHTDLPRKNVIEIVTQLSYTHEIIFMSGRDECCYESSSKWIEKHLPELYNLSSFKLFMRPTGNFEKDSIIKERLFHEHIRDKYYVTAVLDDRSQVVDVWRKKIGIDCLQVNYGNF